jgi:hypothetical protein
MADLKPTEVDSMNRLRVQAENKAALYRRALLLACNGDDDQVAYFVSEADTAIDEERAAAGVSVTALDPNKVQICRVNPVAYDNGQPCACPVGTCNLWRGGLRPSGVKAVDSQSDRPSDADGSGAGK